MAAELLLNCYIYIYIYTYVCMYMRYACLSCHAYVVLSAAIAYSVYAI